MNDIVVGIRIKADGSGLIGEVIKVKGSLDSIPRSGSQAGNVIDFFGGRADAAAAASKRLSDVVSRELDVALARSGSSLGALGRLLVGFGPQGLAAAAVIGGYAAAVNQGTRAYIEHQRELVRLQALLRANDELYGVSAQSVDEFATILSKSTLVADNAVRQAAAALAIFKNVAGEEFFRALRDAQAMAAGGVGDIVSNAQLLGRVFENPAENISLLNRTLRIFDSETEKTVQTLAESGRTAEAIDLVMSKLEQRFGDVAAKEAEVGGGAHRMAQEWRALLELFEQSGAMNSAFNAIANLLHAVNAEFGGGDTLAERIGHLSNLIDRLSDSAIERIFWTWTGRLPALKKELDELIQQFKDEAAAQAEARRNAAQPGGDKVPDSERDAVTKVIEAFDFERAQLHRTAQEQAFYNVLKAAGIGPTHALAGAVKASSDALFAEKTALERIKAAFEEGSAARDKFLERGKQLTEAMLTPQEKFNRAVAEANELLRGGAIEWDIYSRALAAAQKMLIETDGTLDKIMADFEEGSAARDKFLERGKQLTEAMLIPQEQFNKTMEELDGLLAGGAIEWETYQRAQKKAQDDLIASSTRWEAGASRAFKKYADTAKDAAASVESSITGMMNSLEDSFARSELSLESFTAFFEEQIRRLLFQLTMAPLANAASGFFGDLLGGIFGGGTIAGGGGTDYGGTSPYHSGGISGKEGGATRFVPAAALAAAPRLHSGLAPREFTAILKDDEGVFTPEQMKALGRGGGGVIVQIVDQRGSGAAPQVSERRGPDGLRIIRVLIRDEVSAAIGRGDFDPALRQNFGVSRIGVSR